MSWLLVGSALGAYGSYLETQQHNKAVKETYKSTINALETESFINNLKAEQAVDNTILQAYMQMDDFKLEVDSVLSTEVIRRGEGITAGASVARSVQGKLQLASKAMAKMDYNTRSAVDNVYSQYVDSLNINEAKRTQAYNQMKNSLVSDTDAWLRIGSAAISGGVSFSQFGKAFATEFNKGPGSTIESGTSYDIGNTFPELFSNTRGI